MASYSTRRGTIRSGGFELAYSIEGRGPPVLVVGSAVYYPRTFSDVLRTQLQLVFVDHKGFARPVADAAHDEYTLDRVLEDIEQVRQHLALKKIAILGHSGHGYMALEYAKRYPRHVSHVVLIATGPSHSAEHLQLAERNWEETVCPERKAQLERDLLLLQKEIAAAPERRFITFCLRLGARSWFDPHFDARALWAGVQVNMAVIDHLWGEAFRDLDIRQGLAELSVPVVIALGKHDYLIAPYFAWEPYRSSFQDVTFRGYSSAVATHHNSRRAHLLMKSSCAGSLHPVWMQATNPRPFFSDRRALRTRVHAAMSPRCQVRPECHSRRWCLPRAS